MIKRILCLLALMLCFGPYAFSEEDVANEMGSAESEAATASFRDYDSSTKSITNGQYIGGGVTSILLGYGIGHAIQGRYMERGWIFTASELVAIGGYITSVVFFVTEASDVYRTGNTGGVKAFGGVSLAFLVALTGLRVWEIVDAWMLPSHYKIVKESPFQLTPLAYYNQKNMNLGLSLQYKF